MARAGSIPDLRANAYGLGVSDISVLARESGISLALHSEGQGDASVLGSAPAETESSRDWLLGETPVLSLEADIVSLKRVSAGSPVSYGYQYRTSKETTLALVSIGFADGVPRTASMSAELSVAGIPHPVAGRIAMDQLVLDIGDSPAELGDSAIVWGASPTLAQWSQWSARPGELLVSQLAPRVVRIWE
jgi:alanine racemase